MKNNTNNNHWVESQEFINFLSQNRGRTVIIVFHPSSKDNKQIYRFDIHPFGYVDCDSSDSLQYIGLTMEDIIRMDYDTDLTQKFRDIVGEYDLKVFTNRYITNRRRISI